MNQTFFLNVTANIDVKIKQEKHHHFVKTLKIQNFKGIINTRACILPDNVIFSIAIFFFFLIKMAV